MSTGIQTVRQYMLLTIAGDFRVNKGRVLNRAVAGQRNAQALMKNRIAYPEPVLRRSRTIELLARRVDDRDT